ncbi:hypothetical protein ABEV74_15940 [Paenibacillus cisolokensis]
MGNRAQTGLNQVARNEAETGTIIKIGVLGKGRVRVDRERNRRTEGTAGTGSVQVASEIE